MSQEFDDVTFIGVAAAQVAVPRQLIPYLRVIEPRNTYIRLRVSVRPSIIGRSRDVDLPLNDGQISRRHCTVMAADTGVVIEDLDSRNGTWLNGQSIRHAIVTPQDRLQLGCFQLKVEYRDPEDVAQEDALVLAATTDALTGIANRRHLMDCADTATVVAQRSDLDLSVIMLDIDHFKAINDRFGHPAGDAALKCFANVLLREKRRQDVLGRYGGEEFMVLLPGADTAAATHFSQRVRETLETTEIVYADRPFRITASGGVCSAKGCGISSLSAMIARADLALYQAKNNGRNQIVVHSRL